MEVIIQCVLAVPMANYTQLMARCMRTSSLTIEVVQIIAFKTLILHSNPLRVPSLLENSHRCKDIQEGILKTIPDILIRTIILEQFEGMPLRAPCLMARLLMIQQKI